jgi:hypothetical protein
LTFFYLRGKAKWKLIAGRTHSEAQAHSATVFTPNNNFLVTEIIIIFVDLSKYKREK